MKHLASLLGLTLLATACGSDGSPAPAADASAEGDPADAAVAGGADASVPTGEDLDMQAADFGCILDGTRVRGFFVWNLLGHLDETLEVANAPAGGTYPVGSVIQLVPMEAMVKRARGWNPTTNDWEFFALTVSGTTTEIAARGVEDVENAFGGNCFNCHNEAEPAWDLICEDTHGCTPLPIGDDFIMNLQNNDSRCAD